MDNGANLEYSKCWLVLPILILFSSALYLQPVLAEEAGPEPLPQIEPTPFGSVGSCELLDGTYETCYEPMCSLEWHQPPGEAGVWVWRLLFRFRGCNPYDGCVYTIMDECENGCNSSDPLNHVCIGEGDETISEPENFPNQISPDPADDLCYGVHCREAICVGDTSYFGSSECDSTDGRCRYQHSEYCGFGCDSISGYCFGPPEGGACVGISCDPFCDGDTSWFAGQCDPVDGGCMYSKQTCDWGCDSATGLCVTAEDQDLCMSNPCESFCEGDVSYYGGECDPTDGGCFYKSDPCENGCNPETGLCLSADQGGLCAGISCPTFCEDGVSWHDGKCDPADGLCAYLTTPCDAGCNLETGLCLSADQGGLCAGISCPTFCEDGVSWHDGKCDPADGLCAYLTTPCDAGCNESNGLCYPVDSGMDDLLGLLAVGGGIVVAGGGTAGGGLLLYRFLKGRKPPLPKPTPPPAPLPAVDPMIQNFKQQGDRVDSLLKQLKNIHRSHLQHGMDTDQRLAKIAEHKDDVVAKFEIGTSILKKAADTGADIVGLTPGVGRTFKYGYKGVTNWIEHGLNSYLLDGEDAATSVFKGYLKGNLEVAKAVIGDEMGDFVPIPGVNDLGRINMRYARESVSTIIKRKGLANYGTNIIKDKLGGKAVNQGEQLIRVTGRKIRW